MKFDEQFDGIGFADAFSDFPGSFSENSKENIERVIDKWNKVHRKYGSTNTLFAKETFSDDEICAYALYRTILYNNQFPSRVSSLKQKTFEAILKKFTAYYRELSGKR